MMKFLLSIVVVFGIFIHAQAQELTVSGKVTAAADGAELPGVSVRLNNSGQGTVTDIEGNYILAASVSDTLLFTFVGFNARREAVGARNVINVQLQEESKQLGEVVI